MSEIYARPEASLIPELLEAKARDENFARLKLAERAAARPRIIDGVQLGSIHPLKHRFCKFSNKLRVLSRGFKKKDGKLRAPALSGITQ